MLLHPGVTVFDTQSWILKLNLRQRCLPYVIIFVNIIIVIVYVYLLSLILMLFHRICSRILIVTYLNSCDQRATQQFQLWIPKLN
jgi:hypothetical protein